MLPAPAPAQGGLVRGGHPALGDGLQAGQHRPRVDGEDLAGGH